MSLVVLLGALLNIPNTYRKYWGRLRFLTIWSTNLSDCEMFLNVAQSLQKFLVMTVCTVQCWEDGYHELDLHFSA